MISHRGGMESDDDLSPEELAKKSEEALNPHIPQFIAKAPWYIRNENSLEHQRLKEKAEKGEIDRRAKRGVLNEVCVKYRKGACTNCGSMTHQAQDCLERPRKVGAKWTNLDICPDEIIPEVKKARNHDEKRDRWDGFEPEDYTPIIEQFEEVEALAKENRAKKVEKSLANIESNDEDLDDDMKLKDFDETTFGVSTDKTRTNIRNLRIREDTAKYLRNLDLNSAFYDPKSRSMRENPFQKTASMGDSYRGDNEIRKSGDVSKIILMEAFALKKQNLGENIHLQALPTRSEMMYKASINEEEDEDARVLGKISEIYGRKIHSNSSVLLSKDRPTTLKSKGEMDTGNYKNKVFSKYVEDEYISNHTEVWGSYYDLNSKKWGFRCCKQTCRFSKCVPLEK
ncbi:step II splicing factor SLU7 [Cryptosporidium ryanae]|uniref:step II splicing factor SLU7 n=1 Tax=Cryptosporidium ryanae TaxID=515981 RepID=UPI00351A4083|nr:step II splicing factor SLU7 [Cryptosporidium ryanae]